MLYLVGGAVEVLDWEPVCGFEWSDVRLAAGLCLVGEGAYLVYPDWDPKLNSVSTNVSHQDSLDMVVAKFSDKLFKYFVLKAPLYELIQSAIKRSLFTS